MLRQAEGFFYEVSDYRVMYPYKGIMSYCPYMGMALVGISTVRYKLKTLRRGQILSFNLKIHIVLKIMIFPDFSINFHFSHVEPMLV